MSCTQVHKYGEKPSEAGRYRHQHHRLRLVKESAMFGLGLYIYAGEDLPEDEEQKPELNRPGKRTITNEVLARGQQIDALIKKYNMTREDYAGIVSATKAKSPADMTSPTNSANTWPLGSAAV